MIQWGVHLLVCKNTTLYLHIAQTRLFNPRSIVRTRHCIYLRVYFYHRLVQTAIGVNGLATPSGLYVYCTVRIFLWAIPACYTYRKHTQHAPHCLYEKEYRGKRSDARSLRTVAASSRVALVSGQRQLPFYGRIRRAAGFRLRDGGFLLPLPEGRLCTSPGRGLTARTAQETARSIQRVRLLV